MIINLKTLGLIMFIIGLIIGLASGSKKESMGKIIGSILMIVGGVLWCMTYQ